MKRYWQPLAWLLATLLSSLALYVVKGAEARLLATAVEAMENTKLNAVQERTIGIMDRRMERMENKIDILLERSKP